MHGHAIECRINAEDPSLGFVPSPGRISRYVEPNGLGVRVDSGYMSGDEIPDAYDSLIAKLIAWGNDREEARVRMLRALDEFVVEGVPTTIPAHKLLLQSEEFVSGAHTTRTLEEEAILGSLALQEEVDEDVLLVGGRPVRLWHPGMSKSAAASVQGSVSGAEDVVAPMQGTILKILIEPGASVDAGEGVLVLETMKMETTITAPRAGVISSLQVGPGDAVAVGQTLALIEEP
jgi:acetyl-CoA/propionyl-CoA carboxylase biotin carboxyl carrier protein